MAADPRFTWIVRTMGVRPSDRIMEIGPGASDSIACVAELLVDGVIIGVDRSATAIDRARRKHAAYIDAGKARLLHAGLTELDPDRLLPEIGPGATGFDKILAVNVNLFWTRRPTAELDLIRRLLTRGGALHLCYGYGTPTATNHTGPKPASEKLTEHLADAGFAVHVMSSGDLLGVIATPQ